MRSRNSESEPCESFLHFQRRRHPSFSYVHSIRTQYTLSVPWWWWWGKKRHYYKVHVVFMRERGELQNLWLSRCNIWSTHIEHGAGHYVRSSLSVSRDTTSFSRILQCARERHRKLEKCSVHNIYIFCLCSPDRRTYYIYFCSVET